MTWGNRNFLMAGGNKKWIEFSYRDWWPQATDRLLWRTFLVSSRTCLFDGMSDTIDKLLALKLGIYSTHPTTKNMSSWLECANHIKPSPLLPNLWSQELLVCLLLFTVHHTLSIRDPKVVQWNTGITDTWIMKYIGIMDKLSTPEYLNNGN